MRIDIVLVNFARNVNYQLRQMNIQFVNVGFGNIVSTQRIVAIVSPDSAPIKRHINEAKERGQSIDGTYGRRTRAVLIMDSGHVILSAIQPETIASRIQG
jgi:extracellular matrix regulatory protein A